MTLIILSTLVSSCLLRVFYILQASCSICQRQCLDSSVEFHFWLHVCGFSTVYHHDTPKITSTAQARADCQLPTRLCLQTYLSLFNIKRRTLEIGKFSDQLLMKHLKCINENSSFTFAAIPQVRIKNTFYSGYSLQQGPCQAHSVTAMARG